MFFQDWKPYQLILNLISWSVYLITSTYMAFFSTTFTHRISPAAAVWHLSVGSISLAMIIMMLFALVSSLHARQE